MIETGIIIPTGIEIEIGNVIDAVGIGIDGIETGTEIGIAAGIETAIEIRVVAGIGIGIGIATGALKAKYKKIAADRFINLNRGFSYP